MQSQSKLSDMSVGNSRTDPTEPGTGPSVPSYPTLHLHQEHLKKLGIDMPKPGEKHMIHAVAHVVSASSHLGGAEGGADGGEPTGHVVMELRKMAVEPPAKTANEGDPDMNGARAAMDTALSQKAKTKPPKTRDK